MILSEIIIESNLEIKLAVKKLNDIGSRILIVVDEEQKILGVVTDGDIRRWILKNGDFSKEVLEIMNTTPVVLNIEELHLAKKIMKERLVQALPIVNSENKVIDVIFWHDKFNTIFKEEDDFYSPIVIMAGGKGTRLLPLTNVIPKPLIPIGEDTIVELIIRKFCIFGPNKFYLTVNYKKEMIKAYFKEKKHDYMLKFIEESIPLGTGGSLSLLKGKIKETFFVSNCDILIDADYSKILKYHKENNNKITMVTSLRNYVVPYGVINLSEDGTINNIIEKPEYNYLVNTGMYILEPECLEEIPEDTFFHITELVDIYINNGEKVGTYPVSKEAWLDMGEFKEMEIMQNKLL